MGKTEKLFKDIVLSRYGLFKQPKISFSDLLNSEYFNQAEYIYEKMGGQYSEIPVRFGSWDISTKNFIIEVDEERHFNRYRNETLESDFYLSQKHFPLKNYKSYCVEFENYCLRSASWGGNWKNNSTEKMFQQSNLEGNLDGAGSSRWKQRAYYDFLKDITGEVLKVPIVRICIYDLFNGYSVKQLVKENNANMLNELVDFHCSKRF